ncbi:MAG: membrane protein insertion efficiency factor YidD [Defluviitaleaceae bacterium]|nr:membrane protein insertion efficiency factor YidD [Defluviitaleaceae bacterium]
MKKFIMAALRFYKRFISPLLGNNCRFYPSCSVYMFTAVEKYGAAKGVWMGLKRLARCQPFGRGGYDPVP